VDLRRYRYCGVRIASDIVLPALRPAATGAPACTIRLDAPASAVIEAEVFHEWRLGRGRPWLTLGRSGDGYILRFPDLAQFVVSSDGRHLRARPSPGLPENTLHHLLIDQVLPLALSRQGRLMLHASAVYLPGVGAVAFAGRTGSGKSTLAAALAARGARIVADDCLAIDVSGGRPRAWPAYPGLRLWPHGRLRALSRNGSGTAHERVAHYTSKRRLGADALGFHDRASALRAVFLLAPAPAFMTTGVKVRTCAGPDRLLRLLRFAYLLDVDDRRTLEDLFHQLATLVSMVPVRHLRIRRGRAHLPAIADAIRASAIQLAETPRGVPQLVR
jgi:hypothetical protein